MTDRQCTCKNDREQPCPLCADLEKFPYWCTECNTGVPEKRCPLCGLKARKR